MKNQYTDRRIYEVCNKYGIHARPAALLVKAATPYDFEVEITKEENTISGKSIMGFMTLEASQGTKLTFNLRGDSDEISEYFEKIETLEDKIPETGELEKILKCTSALIKISEPELTKHRYIS